MQKLEREQEILTPKVDETGTKTIKRETVEVEKVEQIDPIAVEKKRKSRYKLIVVFGVIALILFAAIIYQVVTVFIEIFSQL